MKTISELSRDHWLSSQDAFSEGLDLAERITRAYFNHVDESAAEREAAVLQVQFREQFLLPEPGDLFVGRVRYPLVGFSPEAMGLGFYCRYDALQEGAECFPALAVRSQGVQDAWSRHTTVEKTRAGFPDWVREKLPKDDWTKNPGVAFPLYRMAGTNLDYTKLLSLGLTGLHQQLEGGPFRRVVPLLQATINRLCEGDLEPELKNLLLAVREAPPATFAEAIQLLWLYALHSGTWNYNRLDVILGPYLERDLASGTLCEKTALNYLCSFWRLIHGYNNQYDNRVIIGGKGRPDEKAADRFAMLAIEATRRVRLNQPQLSLRVHSGQNQVLWEKALDAIGEGCTFPMLYNDDVNIPAVARAFGIAEEMAQNYLPYGCGEYVLGHYSVGSPNGVINLLKALDETLHADDYAAFEDLWEAYAAHLEAHIEALAYHQKLEYDIAGAEAPFAFISALMADCAEKGRGAFGGGARYTGGTLETYGNTNTADSLHVINELVYNQKCFTLRELVTAMDANFDGYPEIHRKCRSILKYGNDDNAADAMAVKVHEHVCMATDRQARTVGLDTYLVVIINNWTNTVMGMHTAASADGRLSGEPMANANNPAPGSDIKGVTAFLNSLAKLSPDNHAGSVQNMKFGKEWFGPMRGKFSALIQAYFANGGTQAMITVASVEDLKFAMEEPEKWGHLMVRVGGFSIRFVELPREAQLEVLNRTCN